MTQDVVTRGGEAQRGETASNGGVTFTGSLAAGDQTFHTSNGNIAVSLPKGTSFRIDADTSHGRVSSTFSVHGEQERKKNQLHRKVGDNPKFSLKLHTSNGSIHVREADASSVAALAWKGGPAGRVGEERRGEGAGEIASFPSSNRTSGTHPSGTTKEVATGFPKSTARRRRESTKPRATPWGDIIGKPHLKGWNRWRHRFLMSQPFRLN